MTAITATIAQYGDAVGFSDLVSTTTIDPILTETTALLGEESGETIDELIRDVLVLRDDRPCTPGLRPRA